MRRYPAWQAIYRSFFSTDFYRDVAANWRGIGFLYLFILATLNAVVFAITIHVAVGTFCDRFLQPIADQWPALTSSDEKFTIDRPCPYYIKDALSNYVLMTFDTSGKTQTLQQPGILVTDDSILYIQAAPESADLPTASAPPPQVLFTAGKVKGSFTADKVKNLLSAVRSYVGIAAFGLFCVFGSIFLFLQALIYGLFGLIFNAVLKTKLEFAQLVRLAAIAITPALVLDTLIKASVGFFPTMIAVSQFFFVVCFVVSMVYLFLGVRACTTFPIPVDETLATDAGPLDDPLA